VREKVCIRGFVCLCVEIVPVRDLVWTGDFGSSITEADCVGNVSLKCCYC